MLNKSVLPVLLRFFLNLSIPSVLAVLFLRSIYDAKPWVTTLVGILSIPLAFTIRVQWGLIRDRRAAAALGATLAPIAPGEWPGNLDILLRIVESFKNGYPGKSLLNVHNVFADVSCYVAQVQEEMAPSLGHVINLRPLWDNLVFTSEPEHIKVNQMSVVIFWYQFLNS